MKRATLKFLTLSSLVAIGLLPSNSPAAEPLPVVASFSILGDLVQVVGGERVKVTTLVGPDADAHAFEPKPAHAKAILQSRLFVINGLNFEPWAQKLARSANYKGQTLVASQGIKVRKLPLDKGHQHAEADPHGWQDPSNVVVYVKNIAKSLASLDPASASSYQKNSETYIKELESLDQFTKDQLAPLSVKQRQVITSHDAFGYFAARYQIIFLAPQGINADVEPSAKEVAVVLAPTAAEQFGTKRITFADVPELVIPGREAASGWSDRSIGRMLIPTSPVTLVAYAPLRAGLYLLAPLPTLGFQISRLMAHHWEDWQGLMNVLSTAIYIVCAPLALAAVIESFGYNRLRALTVPFVMTWLAIAGGNVIIHERYRVMGVPLMCGCIWLGRNCDPKLIGTLYRLWMGFMLAAAFFYVSVKGG